MCLVRPWMRLAATELLSLRCFFNEKENLIPAAKQLAWDDCSGHNSLVVVLNMVGYSHRRRPFHCLHTLPLLGSSNLSWTQRDGDLQYSSRQAGKRIQMGQSTKALWR